MSKYNNNFGADVYYGSGCGVPWEQGMSWGKKEGKGKTKDILDVQGQH